MSLFSSTTPPSEDAAAELAASMPTLAGNRLEPPRFFKTRWQVGQVFTSRDDPDRTMESWSPPDFALRKDPTLQHERMTIEELSVPRMGPSRFAHVLRHAIDEEDCGSLIASVNAKGFTPALLNVGMDQQRLMPLVRDGHRVIVDSPELTAWLFEVLRPYLPEELEDGYRLSGLNERLRFLCYTPGQSFDEHMDGCYRRPHGHPQAGDRSRITVQIYLHDVPAHCGGATTFFPGRSAAVAHQPEAGSVLLFTQDLTHEGSLVKAGIKYTLRTEAMYTKRKDAHPFARWAPAAAPAESSGNEDVADLSSVAQDGEV